MYILKKSEKQQGIFFDIRKILIRVTVFEKKPKNDFEKTFGAPTAQTIEARLTKPFFLEAELNNDLPFPQKKQKTILQKKFRPPSGQTSQPRSKRVTLFEAE